ncbi:hypothetical protein Ddye_000611 [Dipteronia dyeriana]|uniref:Uncharacterized protein n=1 Tax=Dipteronia dyeriana TaxID=168575 RepID=A0AAE0CSP8_9ROSI|nr:hypothetical protein Ddye_000611 [Dipteronia dyeriana]
MLPNSYMATLHHQIVYRLHDRALDLPIPDHTRDIIFIMVEREYEIPTIIQIPKQLPKEKLEEVIPLEWITNYEKAFQNTTPVFASDTKYVKQKDGSIKIVYETITKSKASSSTPLVFQALMIRPITSEDDIQIHSFQADGSPVYTDKIKGHFIWDVDPNMCDEDCECRTCLKVSSLPPPIPCFMASNYDQDFPPLEPTSKPERNLFSRPFIQTIEVLSDRSLKQPSQAEQSDSDTVVDLTQVFMASKIDPHPSTQTVDSHDEVSTGPTPIVEELHENYTHV